jgi:signal transduction histidine kinase
VLNNAGYLNILPVPPTLAESGMVIEAIIISFGILYRYNFFKHEKELLAKQLAEQQLSFGKQIINTQENERKRIAEDLHDELGSSLAALKMHLQKSSLEGNELTAVLQVVDKASEDTRHISHDLMPPEFENTSLFDVLQNFYSRLNTESGIRFHFLASGYPKPISKEDELMIYRIVMEITTNILKHSKAGEVTTQMLYYEKTLEIMVEDNGKGFDKKVVNGIGLKNILTRVNYLQGDMKVDTNSNGTTIIIQIPFKNK